MARATLVKKARKDYPQAGIKKGESYWWWQFAFSARSLSKTEPTRSQLTQSSFLSQLYALEDGIDWDVFETFAGLQDERDTLIAEIDNLRDEAQDSLDNMPEHLQDTSSSGELLTERIEMLEQWRDELENVDCEFDDGDMDKDEAVEKLDELKDELNGISYEGS